MRRELYPHTQAARARIDAAAVDGGRLRTLADLQLVAPITLDDVGDGDEYMVRPTRVDLMRSGSPYMRLRTAWASTWGRWSAYLASIEPVYRPVHFFTADGVPVGAAAADLVRLAGLGVEWLRNLGVGRHESVALVGGAGSGIEAWQLSGGTRRAGISLAVLDDPTVAARHNVNVLAGSEDAVLTALRGGRWPALRLVVVLGASNGRVAGSLRAWAPPGTRSVWYECQGGAAYGWHTTSSAELIEVDEHGEVLWTGLGWAGTVFLRLRTDVSAMHIEDTPCAACGHVGARIVAGEGRPALRRWLQNDPRVAEIRLTSDGAEVLPARAGANARLVSDARKAFPDQTVAVLGKKAWTLR
ncbi:MAG: hypothetical protein QOI61_1451 [Actinomycetota bacterium]